MALPTIWTLADMTRASDLILGQGERWIKFFD